MHEQTQVNIEKQQQQNTVRAGRAGADASGWTGAGASTGAGTEWAGAGVYDIKPCTI